jgi:hypothetical protein
MQQQFQDSISDFSKKLQEIYTRTGSAAQPITPTTTTRDQRRRGEEKK